MTKSLKKLLATAVAATTLLTTCSTAYAETDFASEQFLSEQNSLKQSILESSVLKNIKEKILIGGYECWNMNEQYFTVNDLGEICQVIDLSQIEWTPVENNSEAIAMYSLRSGTNEVDVSGDNVYSGTIDATQSDYTTPVFVGWTPNDPYSDIYPNTRLSYVIRCDDFVFSRQHLAEIHIYNDIGGISF